MKNKLGLIITLALVGVLVITTILLGVINKDYNPGLGAVPNSIRLTDENTSETYDIGQSSDGSEKRDFDKFMQLFNKSFKQSILSSAFAGNLSSKTVVEYKSGSVPSKVGYRVVMNFSLTSIKDKNGTEYEFNEVVFNLENNTGVKTLNLYVRIKDNPSGYLNVSTISNVKALYDFVSELF